MSGGAGKGTGGSVVIGYRYYFGIHMGVGRGPVDELVEIRVGDKTAWAGSATTNTTINIDQLNLFGGDKKEGGIVGKLEVLMGGATQVASEGLKKLFGANVPSAVTVAGAPSGNGLYTKGTAVDGSVIYTAVISSVLWTIARDSFGHWTINNGSDVTYRTTNTPEVPEGGLGWVSVTYSTGSFNWETNQYDVVEVESPVTGLTVTANYTLVPGFRRIFTVFFDGQITANNPYPKPWKFRLRRITQGWDGDVWQPGLATIIMGPSANIKAMNPAHIIYECLTNREWGRGLSRDLIDEASFQAAATQLAVEGFGLCMSWKRTDDIQTFIQTVINHIGASLFLSRSTALMSLRLIRGGYDIETLPHFTPETGLLAISDAAVVSVGNGTNEIQVTYRDPITNEDRTVKATNLAALQAAGGTVISAKRAYPGIPTAELATRVAQRDLRVSAVSLRKFTFTLDRRGRSVEPGMVIKISDPSRGLSPTPVRVGQIEDGSLMNGQISVTALQDVFELPETLWSVPLDNQWQAPDTNACIDVHKVFEVPYFMLAKRMSRADLAFVENEDGYLGAVCAKGKSLNAGYHVATRTGAPTPDDEPNTSDYFCGYTP